MSEAAEDEAVLSREELDALLETLSGGAEQALAWRSSGRRGAPTSREANIAPAVKRSLETFAREQSKSLSNSFQAMIRLSLIGIQEIEPAEFAAILLPSDRIAVFDIDRSSSPGFLMIGRPLFFQLLCLNLGASRGIKRFTTPDRVYTRIEARFYRHFAVKFVEQLDRAWSLSLPVASTVRGVEEPKFAVENADDRMLLASFDVRGFGEVCRLRVAVSTDVFASLRKAPRESSSAGANNVQDAVLRMSVDLDAEIGTVELPLSEIAHLRVGTVLPIQPHPAAELVIRIGGQAKFRATRGSVGKRAAVQLVERV